MSQRRPNSRAVPIDWLTVALYALFVAMGWVFVYAAVYNEEHSSIFDLTQRYGKQLVWICASAVLVACILMIDCRIYIFFSYAIYAFFMIALVGVLLFGVEVNGARSWFQVGGLRLQPAEFAKIATVLALANYLSEPNRRLMTPRSLLTVAALVGLPAGLIILQNDTGSTLVFASLVVMLYREGLPGWIVLAAVIAVAMAIVAITQPFHWVAGIAIALFSIYTLHRSDNKKKLLIRILISYTIPAAALVANWLAGWGIGPHWILIAYGGALLPVAGYHAFLRKRIYLVVAWGVFAALTCASYGGRYMYSHILRPHQRDRIDHVLGINFDPRGAGYNVNQSMIAIGSGGLTGKGFLQGTQTKYDFVPEQSTDFIFCTIGEEWGFVGCTLVITMLLAMLLRLICLAERQRSRFSRVYGYGVVSILAFHVIVNIGMTIGVTPVIGIPLPFFSYGGSSLWAFTILLFIFLKLDSNRNELVK